MRSHVVSIALVAAALCSSDAAAYPTRAGQRRVAVNDGRKRIVVLPFDGNRQLADVGRSAVLMLLDAKYNIVPTRQWEATVSRTSDRGRDRWQRAAKQAGVCAIVEGWVQAEGKHDLLTLAVRDAATGSEVDSISLRIKKTGITSEVLCKLGADLEDLFNWIESCREERGSEQSDKEDTPCAFSQIDPR